MPEKRATDVEFSACFSKEKIDSFKNKIPLVYKEIRKLRQGKISAFPSKIECMTNAEIKEGKELGGGHGLYILPARIKINRSMSSEGIFMNFIHENLHYALPELQEKGIDILTEYIGCRAGIGAKEICRFLEEAS